MNLYPYQKKRNFLSTPEPKGKVSKDESGLFIIQKHAASHLHYDFRIALHGVLKSWAIPKGPSMNPDIKRLAIHVEDHPIQYGSFEGVIPKGQYGGGTVMLWDKGIWRSLDKNPYEAYEKGHLRLLIHAEKLQGRWDLIRFKDEKHWFLIKYRDEFSRSNQKDYLAEKLNKSVVSGRTMDEITQNHDSIWANEGEQKIHSSKKSQRKPAIKLPKNLIKSALPDFILPELATLVDKAPEGTQWIHEIKLDGYRILAFKNGSEISLKSRNNISWSHHFPFLMKSINRLPWKQIILDGEVVVLDEHGRSNFQLLQNCIKNKQDSSFVYFIFDILYFNGYDLRELPLHERKSILKKMLEVDIPSLHYSDHIIKEGKKLYQYSCEQSLEGIISKRRDSPYISGRTRDWFKIKCLKRQEFVIGGYTLPKGDRSHFGALLLGLYNQQGTLDFAGKVGTGFTEKTLQEIHRLFQKKGSITNPFNSNPPGYTTARWLKPDLVCEIEFTEWTKDHHVRHPSFKGLRMDKKAMDIMREQVMPLKEITMKKTPSKIIQTPPFVLSSPNKILYPEDKITKKDLLDYYETVSDYMLPFISRRPLTLLRCPSDYNRCFYQRHFNKSTPDTLFPVEDPIDKVHERYIYLHDKKGLFSLVQMGVLEIHPWGSLIDDLEKPDMIVFDLDPAPDVTWKKVVSAALEIRDHLARYHLKSFVKTTGGKGLHVVIPVMPEYDWIAIKNFSHVFVQFLEKLKPEAYTSTMTKARRTGKIFIDYLRNQKTATAIAVYSTRARMHAPVSTPLSWDELSSRIKDNSYTIKTLPKRLEQLREDPWKDFWNIRQSLRLDELE